MFIIINIFVIVLLSGAEPVKFRARRFRFFPASNFLYKHCRYSISAGFLSFCRNQYAALIRDQFPLIFKYLILGRAYFFTGFMS
jgi:hypothetical protein